MMQQTGNPNVKGLPKWEPYNEETGVTMILDNQCEPRQHHDRELMEMSRSIQRRSYRSPAFRPMPQ